MTSGTEELHISQEDILIPGVQDEFAAELPIMANGPMCAKNWDISLLQNCTMDRIKFIARDYESVGTNIRTKTELYCALYEAMSQDTNCETCN